MASKGSGKLTTRSVTIDNNVIDVLVSNSELRRAIPCLAAAKVQPGCCGKPATVGYDEVKACLATCDDTYIKQICTFLGVNSVRIWYGVYGSNGKRSRLGVDR
jgi:hypothetical protein